jgi:cell division protein ZapA
MAKDDGRLVSVEINGLRYPIRSHLDAAYVADLAAYVEQKMLLAARESPAGDTLKIAVLAALNIADECFRARQEGSAQAHDLTERARALERMLDLALEAGPEPLAPAAGSH